jgi:hypothetical protein
VRSRPDPRPGPADVVVVDASEYGLAERLAAAVGPPAVVRDELAVGEAGGLVLVLPVGLDETRPGTRELWLRLQLLAQGTVGHPAWIVALWAVRHAERQHVATAYDGSEDLAGEWRYRGRNATLLLTGDGWRRELHRHRGDPAAATRCRSAQMGDLLAADSHRHLCGTNARHACRDLAVLDPGVLHGVLVEVARDGRGTGARWTGWEAASAAVALRQTGPRPPDPLDNRGGGISY